MKKTIFNSNSNSNRSEKDKKSLNVNKISIRFITKLIYLLLFCFIKKLYVKKTIGQ